MSSNVMTNKLKQSIEKLIKQIKTDEKREERDKKRQENKQLKVQVKQNKKIEKRNNEIQKKTAVIDLMNERKQYINTRSIEALKKKIIKSRPKTLEKIETTLTYLNQLKDVKLNVKNFNETYLSVLKTKEDETKQFTVYIKFNILRQEEGSIQKIKKDIEQLQNGTYPFHIAGGDEGVRKKLEFLKTYKIYLQTIDFNDPTNEKVDTFVREDTQHYSMIVKGKQNIQNDLKKWIESLIGQPYVIKIKILDIHINKHITSMDEYRWLGGKKDRREHLKYLSAWNAQNAFVYHGYNLDVNKETEYECVPSAFYKMYGVDKTKRSYIARIAKGGMMYVKELLNDFHKCNSIYCLNDDGNKRAYKKRQQLLERIKNEKIDEKCEKALIIKKIERDDFVGYTPADILDFCNYFKILCVGLDFKFQKFITNKNTDININNDLLAFVFYMNDEHIYLIDDKETRHSILHSHNKSDIISIMTKEREIKENQRNNIVNMPFDEWKSVEKTDIYITESGEVNELFYKLLCNGDVFNKKLKMNDGEGVVRFEYLNKNVIIYNPDYYIVIDTLSKLNQLDGYKYTFKNQRINTLAKEVLDTHFGGYPLSTMNEEGDNIFHSNCMRNCMFNGWISEPQTTTKTILHTEGEYKGCEETITSLPQLSAYDYNKHYTSCFMGEGVEFGWCVYNVFDEVKPFDGKLEAGYYFVEVPHTNQHFDIFSRGNGWYEAEMVAYGVENDIIDPEYIKYMYKPSTVLPADYFKDFIEFVYMHFEKPKDAINKMVGWFGRDYSNKNSHHFTTDARLAFMELNDNDDVNVKYVYHDKYDNKECQELDINHIDINKHMTNAKPLCYHLFNMKELKHFQNALPFFYKIYAISAVKMHRMSKLVGGVVRGVFTDTIIFQDAERVPECDSKKIGGIRETSIKEFSKVLPITFRNDTYSYNKKKLTIIDEFKFEDNKGMYMTGMAGTGKTYTTNMIKSQLQSNQYIVSTPTHKSALLVNGETIFNAFNINPIDFTYLKTRVEKLKASGVEWVFIDEISMIQSKVWAVLRDIKKIYNFKFILVGDFMQLDPVENKIYDVENSDVFYELCDGRKMELTKNYRAMNDPEFSLFIDDLIKVRDGNSIDFKTYGKKECRRSLCWTNDCRNAINYKQMMKESEKKKYVIVNNMRVFEGLPIISNETKTYMKEYEVKNNEEFVVSGVDINNIVITNDRYTITLSHKEFKYFDLAYCLTVHKSQGSTYDFDYTIYEARREGFHKKLLYTAMSRATTKSRINFGAYTPKTYKGFIYKIVDSKNKIYIGSTTNPEERWKQHCLSSETDALHTAMREQGTDNFKFEVIKEVQVSDNYQLWMQEACMIMHCDSIVRGFNSKYPIDINNI